MATVQPLVEDTNSFVQRDYSPAAKRALARKPALFINNEWVASSHGATLIVEDPSTGREVGRIVDASDGEDVDRAVAAARAAFDDGRWSNLPPKVRERTILKLADLIEAHAAEFAELEAIDNGKPVGFATMIDIPGSVDHLRYMAGWATKISGDVVDPLMLPRGQVFSYVLRQPVGVAALITPWNGPQPLATLKIAPALAAGCTVILKPAEQTSVTALRLADPVAEAGFPPGVINVITGNAHTARDRHAARTSTRSGSPARPTWARSPTAPRPRLQARHARARRQVTRDRLCRTSTSTKSPAPSPVAFSSTPGRSASPVRAFAHRSIFDRMVEGVSKASAFWKPRPSLDPQGHMGPLVSKEQMDRVMGYLEAGKRERRSSTPAATPR